MLKFAKRMSVNKDELQRKIRAAQRNAEIYGLESVLEVELAKEGDSLEHFNLHVEYEKLQKDSKANKLIYLYLGIVVGIILTLLVAVFFT